MGYEEKRRRVANYVEEISAGTRTLAKVPYEDRNAVAVEGLLIGVVKVEDISPKQARWVATDLVKGAPYRERDAAADRGTDVHHWAEQIVLGTATHDMVPEDIRGHVEQWQKMVKWLDLEFVATEFTVYNREYGYAGSGDFLARSGRFREWGLILGDYKTSESGLWADIALQLVGLKYGEFIGLPDGTEEPMPKIDTCLGVCIRGQDWYVQTAQADPYIFQYFKTAQDMHKWKTEVESTVLGPKITEDPWGEEEA